MVFGALVGAVGVVGLFIGAGYAYGKMQQWRGGVQGVTVGNPIAQAFDWRQRRRFERQQDNEDDND